MMAASPGRMRRRRTSGAAITAHCPPFSLYSGSPSALHMRPQQLPLLKNAKHNVVTWMHSYQSIQAHTVSADAYWGVPTNATPC